MKSVITSTIVAALIAGTLAGGWLIFRDTEWYTSLSEHEDASDLPSDLTDVFNTAIATRADVTDSEELDATLNYIDRVEFVHRIDPDVVTTTATSGGGRNAQTETTTVETPGNRAITALPDVGDRLAPGDVLYETDSTPVYLAVGQVAAWRTMDDGSNGTDVAQLQLFLIAGSWDTEAEIEPDGVWSAATTAAVENWQSDTGQAVTGHVTLGDIWFIPDSIRIVSVESAEGVAVSDGDAVLTYTSSDRRIEASVNQIPDGLLSTQDISAQLPDGQTAAAELTSVRGTDSGFDLVFSIDLEGVSTDEFNRLPVTLEWTKNEVNDELTLPPEAIKRVDSGQYVVEVLQGDQIERVPVEIIGQAGRVVAVTGIDERAVVLIP
jgi:hypothetical protein